MRKPLSLRQKRRCRARYGKPLPTPHHAHTAGGRDISGLWEWFERIVLMATLISIGLGIWAFLIDYEDRKQARAVNAATLEEIKASQISREQERKVNEATLAEIEDSRKVRTDEAIDRAWSLLATPATGNSGKREALEYLAGQGVPMQGIDLSCARMGGGWDDEKKTCETPVYLRGVTLKAPEGQQVNLTGAHLEGAELWEAHLEGAFLPDAHLEGATLGGAHLEGAELMFAHLEGATLHGTHLEGADLWDAHLEGADLMFAHLEGADLMFAHLEGASLLEARLEGAHLEEARLEGADLWRVHLEGAFLRNANLEGAKLLEAHLKGANLLEAHLEGANLTSADFTDAKRIDSAYFTDSWAWAAAPPKGLPASIAVTLCQYQGGMDPFTRPEPCLPPG